MPAPQFEIYADRSGNFRWRLMAANGKKIAASGESFASRAGALRAARAAQQSAAKAGVPALAAPGKRPATKPVAKRKLAAKPRPKPAAKAKAPARPARKPAAASRAKRAR